MTTGRLLITLIPVAILRLAAGPARLTLLSTAGA